MAKADIQNLLKRRMAATQQASDLAVTDQVYHKLFEAVPLSTPSTISNLPLEKLVPFQTAEIGFRPYPPAQLEALSQQLQEDGLMVRIIVRPRPDGNYEILAGHNRTNAARLAGWTTIPAEIVEADDTRAIVIATSTNLIQRQRLSILERGLAYKALLDAKNRQGFRSDQADSTSGEFHQKSTEDDDVTSGELRQRYSARALVAEFFGVTEHEIRKAIKLTRLIPELQTMLEATPKQLNLSCAALLADYDETTQTAILAIVKDTGCRFQRSHLLQLQQSCKPPTVAPQQLCAAWNRTTAVNARPNRSTAKNLVFDRKRFAPYLQQFRSDAEIEELFLAFLREYHP